MFVDELKAEVKKYNEQLMKEEQNKKMRTDRIVELICEAMKEEPKIVNTYFYNTIRQLAKQGITSLNICLTKEEDLPLIMKNAYDYLLANDKSEFAGVFYTPSELTSEQKDIILLDAQCILMQGLNRDGLNVTTLYNSINISRVTYRDWDNLLFWVVSWGVADDKKF